MTQNEFSTDTKTRGERIVDEVTSWPGITTDSGEFGETEFFLEGRAIGHVHGSHMADIPFPRRLRDQLVAEGRTGPHHVMPDSGWTTKYIRADADADEVVALLRLNYDRITERRKR
jgi:Luciferase